MRWEENETKNYETKFSIQFYLDMSEKFKFKVTLYWDIEREKAREREGERLGSSQIFLVGAGLVNFCQHLNT